MSELKQRLDREYILKTSPSVLFDKISTPSGLQEWFADKVSIGKNIYSFTWDGVEEIANVITIKKKDTIKLSWKDSGSDAYYFEMKIKIDSLTKEVALLVTDYVDDDEVEEMQMWWDNQVQNLKHLLGS